MKPKSRIGIDFGGTKIEILILNADGTAALRRRVPNPRNYEDAIQTVKHLVEAAESETNTRNTVGVGIPGAISPFTGLVHNANSVWMNDRPFDTDLAAALGRPVRVENDANCFALSEASDGAAADRRVVFGVILGTGCGGAIVVDGKLLAGPHCIAGEWGHNPLPWPTAEDLPYTNCFCGNTGCLEGYIAGPALAADYYGSGHQNAQEIPALAGAGDARAAAVLRRHADRTARALAQIINFLDPDAIVLGGGLSNLDHLYSEVPQLLPRHVIAQRVITPILRNKHGDSSGVRGAAWLWGKEESVLF